MAINANYKNEGDPLFGLEVVWMTREEFERLYHNGVDQKSLADEKEEE